MVNSTSRTTIENVSFNPSTLTYDLEISGLLSNNEYIFNVYGDVDLLDGNGIREGYLIGSFRASTPGIDSLIVDYWRQNTYTADNIINVDSKINTVNANSTLGDNLYSLTFNLYQGDVKNEIASNNRVPIATFTDYGNLKDKYYNRIFNIGSLNIFNINSVDDLKLLSGGSLARYYTIEITDAYDYEYLNRIEIEDNIFVYQTPKILLLEEELDNPIINVSEITNSMLQSGNYSKAYDSSLGDSIVVGYKVVANAAIDKISNYFPGDNPVKSINFYVYNTSGTEIASEVLNLDSDNSYETFFFLDYGTDYATVDNTMRRGNTYTFAFDIAIDTDNNGEVDDYYPSSKVTSQSYTSLKQSPTFYKYIINSTDNSITYSYKVNDIDNAIYQEDGSYNFYSEVNEDSQTIVMVKDNNYNEMTISNLTNNDIYNLYYKRALSKTSSSEKILIGSYLFDGHYDASYYDLTYTLVYTDSNNQLMIQIDDVENDAIILDRMTAYQVDITDGNSTYERVFTSLSNCGEDKCIIIDYSEIKDFKGKNLTVSLKGYYDNGYIGFNQTSIIGNYFSTYVNSAYRANTGFVLQNTNTTVKGKYLYIEPSNTTPAIKASDNPKGIYYYNYDGSILNISNIVNMNTNSFVNLNTIRRGNILTTITFEGIYSNTANQYGSNGTINPKVLDQIELGTENNTFKFTSITPKVSTTVNPLINGTNMIVTLSGVDSDILASDFMQSDNKYNFYIDIYSDLELTDLVDSVIVSYENLDDITIEGLTPDTTYYYTISADMNENGSSLRTKLFDLNKSGYVEFVGTFSTLGQADIFNFIRVFYNSETKNDIYSVRTLNLTTVLKTTSNFDLKYELFDINDNVIINEEVTNANFNHDLKTAVLSYDITGNDFVFGNNYHRLKITAITTDTNSEVILYDELLKTSIVGNVIDIDELIDPTFSVTSEASIKDNNNYTLTFNVSVTDTDKVITDGIYYAELRNAVDELACQDCVRQLQAGVNTEITFENLQPDTRYVLVVYANTYKNNVSLSNPNSTVESKYISYTSSDLGISLGGVVANANSSQVILSFIGGVNIPNIKKVDYTIMVTGGSKVSEGSYVLGVDKNFTKGSEDYYQLIIDPDGLSIHKNIAYYIVVDFYVEDSNEDLILFGGSSYTYDIIYES